MIGLNQLIQEAIADGVMPGANYCLIAKGRAMFGSFGKKALYPTVEDNSVDTLYDMASLTKVICTTTAIMKLVEAGKIRLYDSVKTYLPEFIHSDVTIWDLMTHSSGLPSNVQTSLYNSPEELRTLVFNAQMKHSRHEKILYSDLGYILLGWIIEAISKMPLDVFAKKYVFEPLDMVDSCFNPVDIKRCAPTEDRGPFIDRGYVHDEKAHMLNGVAGHAGLFSTVKDVSHFMKMILNQGVYNGKTFLSQRSIDLFYTVQVMEQDGVSQSINRRSLGWLLKGDYPSSGDLVSDQTIMHTGFTGTNIFIDRDNKIAFTMLANRVHPTRDNLKIIAFRAKLGNYIMSHF